VPGKHPSQAKSFLEEEQRSRRGPRQQTRAVQQQKTQVEQLQTRMGEHQEVWTWRPLRTAEGREQPQCPRGSGRQLGGHPEGPEMP
jgi:hypothetical protein